MSELEAGREMDALVAEKVMGWEYRNLSHGFYDEENHKFYPEEEFQPNTDIAAAWQVVEKFLDQYDFDLNNLEANKGEWMATIKRLNDDHYVMAKAATAPLAICRAALKAVEE